MSENKNLCFTTLKEFLDSVKITNKKNSDTNLDENDKKNTTHTSLANLNLNIYPCKYSIKKEYFNYFVDLYCKYIFEWNQQHHLTEKHHDIYSPVLIDLDFRYNFDKTINRKYNLDNIITFVNTFINILSEIIEINDKQKICFIMEKSKPILDKNIIKDGIHIIFPYIISTYEPLFITRNILLENQNIKNLFKNLGYINPINDIIDEAVIKRNNWFMYGSNKPDKEPYLVTNILEYNNKFILNNKLKDNYTNKDLIKLLSINNFDEVNICPIINNDLINEFKKKIEGKKKTITNKNKKKGFKNSTTMENLDIIRKLVNILSVKRADNFENWIRTGWCLHNIDYNLLDSWIDFSKKSSKYEDGVCEEKWEEMDNRGLNIGSLHRWCKEDNFDEYNKIIRSDLENLIRLSLNKTDYDIAKVIYRLYKYDFVCCSVKNNQWYSFKNNRWHPSDGAVELKKKISEQVVNEYIKYAAICSKKVLETQEEEERETLIKRGIKSNEICLKLKNETFKNNIIKSCTQLFSDPKFIEKLDSNVDLIGFDNGVYDLEKNEFRKGLPDDFISFSTNINYNHYNYDDQIIKDIILFLQQVLPIPRVKEYVLKVMGSFLSGKTGEEKFHIWTGCGGNGKSKLIELFEYAFGDYCGKMSVTLITQKRAASNACTPELVANKGKRFVTLQEPDNNEEIHVGAMKELTGGDKIQGRGLHKDPIQFKPQWKMVMTSNVLPQVSSNERGTWRRIRVTEFVSRFVEITEIDPKKKYQFPIDHDLSSKLKEWPEAFIWLLIQEYYNYKKNGLKEPPEVDDNTRAYEEECDTFTQFCNEKIKQSPGDKIKSDDVYHIYKEWFKNAGVNIKTPTKKDLIKNLTIKYGPFDRNKMWKGLSFINNDYDDDEDEDDD